MQEQNFEKQVQKKLEELNLSPSAPVWKKVEEEIRKKKDKKRFFFWLIPFLLLCGGIYVYSDRQKSFEKSTAIHTTEKTLQEKNNNQRPPETTNNNSTTSNKQSNAKNQTAIPSENSPSSEKLITDGPPVKKHETKYPVTIKTSGRLEDKRMGNQNDSNTAERELRKAKEKMQGNRETNFVNTDEKKRNDNKKVIVQANEKIAGNNINEKDIQKPADNNSVNKTNTVDTISQTTSPLETVKDTVAVALTNEADTVQKTQTKTNTKKRWKLSASLAGGSAGIATSVFGNLSQGGAQSLDALRYYSGSAFAQNTATNGPILTTYYPSDIKNGFSFWDGVELGREFSKRLQFNAGLFYHFYSTSITVGKKISQPDTITRQDKSIRVEKFYSVSNSGQTERYKNSYHFMEIPVGIKWQLIKNIPLQLETGFRMGRLIKTNALHYDSQQSIYYEDEQLFKRMQFSFYTGLSYRILRINKASLYIGPKAQFQLTNLLPKNEYGKQHLYFTGVETNIAF